MRQKYFLLLLFLTSVIALADPPTDSSSTLALWHMNAISNPIAQFWSVVDNDASNLYRNNNLTIGYDTNVLVAGGVDGNALYFDGTYRFSSTNNWENLDTIKIEFDVKPLKFDTEQRLLEITSAISVRFQPNSGHTHGRIWFVVYDDGGDANSIYSGWLTASAFSNQWKHAAVQVHSNGTYSVSLEGTTDVTGSGLSGIDNAHTGMARCYVGGDHSGGNVFHGYLSRIKISYDIPKRPNLLFSFSDLPELRNKAQRGVAKDIYTLMKSKADAYLSIATNPYAFTDATAGRTLSKQLLMLGMTGYISGESKYINKAIDVLCSAVEQSDVNTFVGFNGHLAVADAAKAYTIAYDWLEPYMTAGQTNLVKTEIYQFGAWLYNAINTTYVGDQTPQRFASNHNAGTAGALGLCGLILENNAPGIWVSRATHQTTNYFIYSTDATGCAYEGMQYMLYAFQGAIPYSVGYEREKGTNIILPKMSQIPQYYMWQLTPEGGGGIPINQTSTQLTPAGEVAYLISKYQDGIGLWGWNRFADDLYGYTGWGGAGSSLPYSFLWYDPDLTITNPTPSNIGQSKLFARGQISARDGWTNDDSLVTFTCGTGWSGCWNHSDEGSFTFDAKSERFVVDAAAGYTTSKEHNTITVDGYGQNNDGWAAATIGEITTYRESNDFMYVYGDATDAYDSSSKADATKAKRQLMYVRAPQPYIVIADDFAVDDFSSHNYSLLLHTAPNNSISINGDIVTITGGNVGSHCYVESIWPTGVSITETSLSGSITNIYKELKININARYPEFITLLVAAGSSETMPAITRSGDWNEMIINLTFSNGRQDKITVMPTNIEFETN